MEQLTFLQNYPRSLVSVELLNCLQCDYTTSTSCLQQIEITASFNNCTSAYLRRDNPNVHRAQLTLAIAAAAAADAWSGSEEGQFSM